MIYRERFAQSRQSCGSRVVTTGPSNVAVITEPVRVVFGEQMGETADVAGRARERQLQRGRVDADAQSGAAPGVRAEHTVDAVQPEHGRTVPRRLGEQAVHQSVVRAAAAGQELPAAVVA